MRIPKIENYNNNNVIEKVQLHDVEKIKKHINIMNEKDKIKTIKTIERMIRKSLEYKLYVKFLKDEIDMTMCSFFNNISNKESKRVSIEIHHEPFTLFDITMIILEKHIAEGRSINLYEISEEVMKLHYQGKIGLVPLSLTVHQLVHGGKLFIPLQNVYGNFIALLEEYDEYIKDDLKQMLEIKLRMSKDASSMDLSILERKYVYLEVDGMTFPQPLEA